MPADVRTFLDRAAGHPGDDVPDFDAIARRGRRRRVRQRAARTGSGLAAVALVAVVGGQLLTDARTPSVLLDSPPKPGAGTWELLAEAPLEAAKHAEAVDLGDGTVLVVGGTTNEPGRGQSATRQAALYDLGTGEWTALPPVPFVLNNGEDHNASRVRAQATGDGRAVAWRDWLGQGPGFEAALLDPVAGQWVETGAAPLRPRAEPIVEWIDGHLVVWGGHDGDNRVPDVPESAREALEAMGHRAEPVPGGAVWSPGGGWQPMSDAPLSPRIDPAAAVVDERLIVWGGADGGADAGRRLFADGAVYDVTTDRWTELPAAGLAERTVAVIVPDGDGFILAGGMGPGTTVESYEEPAATEDCDDNGACPDWTVHRSYHPDPLVDGARYDWAQQTWTPLPVPADDVKELSAFAGTLYGASPGQQVVVAYDPTTQSWAEAPQGLPGWADLALGGRLVRLTDPDMVRAVRLGGTVFDPDRGRTALAEADTPARTGAAVTSLGQDAVFVWGGSSLIPGENPHGDPHRSHRLHNDGALWHP